MNRHKLTPSQLRPGDVVLFNPARQIVVGGVARLEGSRPDVHLLDRNADVGAGPGYGRSVEPDEVLNVVRRDRPMVAYAETRDVHVGMRLLADPRDLTGLDYDPNDGSDMAVYVVYEWREIPATYGTKIEIKATPLNRDTPGGNIVLCESPTFPLRLAEWPEVAALKAEVAVLTGERDATLERVDMIEREGVERPGVGAVAS